MPSLIWKEWHEQSWKLGLACVVLVAMAVIGLRARIIEDEMMIAWVCAVGMLLMPVLAASGLVPAERSEGSFGSLLALPVARWRILAAKTTIGMVLCAVPLILAAVASLLIAGGREMTGWEMFTLYARSTAAGVLLFVWALALTIRLPNETRAGLLGVGILIFWIMATLGLAYPSPHPWMMTLSPLALVYGFFNGFDSGPPLVAVLVVQVEIAVVLWWWASRQIGGGAEER
jgi:ABC-type transport system involved in multi-copper enzyme maturation permease subunit